MIMLFQGKVDVLEEHTATIRTVRFSLKIPSVLKLKYYVRVKRPMHIRFSRENVYVRDDFHCQYCREKYHAKSLTLDHVIPASQGGKKTWTNIVTACIRCNQKKGGRTPDQANMLLWKSPAQPTWLPKIQEEFTMSYTPEIWKSYLFAV